MAISKVGEVVGTKDLAARNQIRKEQNLGVDKVTTGIWQEQSDDNARRYANVQE